MAVSEDKHGQLLKTLKEAGPIERSDLKSKDSASSDKAIKEDMPDAFYDLLRRIGLEQKDVLFLGPLNSSHQSLSKIDPPVRSLENLDIFPDAAKSLDKRNGNEVKNGEEKNGGDGGDSCILGVTSPADSKDIVVINLVSNHLETDALRTLINDCVAALRTNGILVMREYLDDASPNSEEDLYFRDVATTCSLMNSATSASGKEGLQLLSASAPYPVGGQQEVTWQYKKVSSDATEKKLQEFLDASQYSKKGILKYEKVFGHRFVSTGGKQTTMEFCQLLHLQPGQKVLDVCCGIGGSAFHMAQEFGVEVHGVDLSSNMISIGIDRRRAGNFHKVDFEICNVLTKDFVPESYDVIYSRDAIMHIVDKQRLFQTLFKCLKPGGRLFITDYCCGANEHSQEFKDYVQQRGYNLLTVVEYGKLLENAGFINVKAEDRTEQFVDILRTELTGFEPQESDFVREFSQSDYDEIIDGWQIKVKRCHAGDQAWGIFLAHKK